MSVPTGTAPATDLPAEVPADSPADAAVHSAGTDAATDPIGVLRGQIDSLDEAIIRLVAERARLSSRVQAARMSAGGTRVQIGRERVIMAAYRQGLGPQGPGLAESILQVCRGAR